MARDRRVRGRNEDGADDSALGWPGKRALTDSLGQPSRGARANVPGRRALTDALPARAAEVRDEDVAAQGTAGGTRPLPHLDLIQRAFGRHDVSRIRVQVGG